ncbi:cysteine proteinase [Coprinopsis marcescibilis]|uniref:ubiquitinyl hydrolase 1 n=1 Tax=Coprinopsis marcescibilis TaxID=230819 RepID=A0A5C3L2A9_COPMA|nr:cysteine proteinase [Coprinopsis marcescibilis]
MARSKWISFAAQHALSKETQKSATDPPSPQSTSSADIKKFGLENALYFCTPFRDLMLQALDSSVPQDVPPGSIASTSYNTTTKAQGRLQPERKPSTSIVTGENAVASSSQPAAVPIPPSPPTLFSALRSLFYNIYTQPGDKGIVSPKTFIDKLKELNEVFRSTMHQDAHEFLNFLLNRIVEEMEEERKQIQNAAQGEDLSGSVATLGSKVPPTVGSSTSGANARDATLVHKLFEGILTSETRCLTCETVSSRDESFLDLSIDIEQNSSVTACLRQFSASEMLCNRNKFFCDSCCDLQEAEKRMKIKKLPNVLALHLKRFKYQEDVGRYIKLTYRVAFPMNLRLFNTVDDMEDADRLYHLFAIVVHIGNGPHHGHYISIIKNGGSWFVFDDDSVSPIPESDIPKYFGESNSGSAYVLYYQADDLNLAALGIQTPESPTPPPAESSIEISASQPSSTLVTPVGPPPGLEHYDPYAEIDAHSNHIVLNPPLIVNENASPASSPIHPNNLTIDNFGPLLTPTTAASPSTTSFGAKIRNTLRRAPSASLTKGSLTATSSTPTDGRKSAVERSPRPSASSPSLSGRDDLPSELPPPVPPLPPMIQTTPPPPGPIINGDDKEKTKPQANKSGGWFTKRKSLRLGDKTEKSKTVSESPGAMPPSPNRRNEDQPTTPSASTWFRGFSAAQREGQTPDHGRSKDTPTTISQTHLSPRNGYIMNGYDDTSSNPGSTSSSLNSSSPSQPPFATSLPPTRASTSYSSASIPRSHGFPNENTFSRNRSQSPSSRNRQRQKPFPKQSGEFERALPPLPHHVTDPIPQYNGTENGYSFVAEPETLLPNGYHELNHSSSLPPPATFPEDGHDVLSHMRSTTLPPSSLASSVGANLSSGTNSSTTSGIRKATRKLSLTAPMLGFGRNKDKKP